MLPATTSSAAPGENTQSNTPAVTPSPAPSDKKDPAFIEKVAARVYELMVQDARRERERRG